MIHHFPWTPPAKAQVLLADANGELLSLRAGLSVGTAPMRVVLAQREGLPQTVEQKLLRSGTVPCGARRHPAP